MTVLNTTGLMPRLDRTQNRVNVLANDVTSGVRIHRPSDDPVGAARLLDVNTSISENAQYISNAESANTMLALQDTSMEQIISDLQSIREAVMESMNAPTSPEQMKIQAVKVKSGYDSLMTQANGKTPYGFMFSGFQEQQPFVETTTGSTYQGDSNHRELRIGPANTLRTTFTGQELFLDGEPGKDMFALTKEIKNQMDTGSINLTDARGWLKSLDTQLQHVTHLRAQAGVRMNEAENVVDRYTERNTALNQEKSNLEDTDIPSSMIEINNKKAQIQATYQTIATLGNLSIFDYIK